MKETDMNIYICSTTCEQAENNLVFTDVPPIPFLNCTNPLYIGARTGQVNRMKKLIEKEKLGGLAIGWWELAGKTPIVFRSGKLNTNKLNEHDVIFIANPERVHEKLRPAYQAFIDTLLAAKQNKLIK